MFILSVFLGESFGLSADGSKGFEPGLMRMSFCDWNALIDLEMGEKGAFRMLPKCWRQFWWKKWCRVIHIPSFPRICNDDLQNFC